MGRKITVGTSSVELKDDPLVDMVRGIEEADGAYVKVGLWGSRRARKDKTAPNNPTIGAVHEFGSFTKGIPQRSFLRMPLIEYLPEAIKALGEESWRALILEKGFAAALTQLGVLAVSVVQDAFESGGFGKWAPLKKATIRRKKSSAILIDTGDMRQDIRFKVVMPKLKAP